MTITPQEELAAVRAEAAELQQQIDTLEAQVREGQEQDAAQELGRRYGLRRLVELRQEAAERKAALAEAEQLEGRRLAVVAAAEADLTQLSIEHIAQTFTEAVEALELLARLGKARQDAIERHARAFVDVGLPLHHQDGGWIVFDVEGTRYDTRHDACRPEILTALVEQELARRKQITRRLDLGFTPPEPLPHPVTQFLADCA